MWSIRRNGVNGVLSAPVANASVDPRLVVSVAV